MRWLTRLLGPSQSEDTAADADRAGVDGVKRVYELALKQREFEITQLTQRNNFFMIFQGVLIAGLVQSQGQAAALISFMLCFTGMVVSIFQIGMAGGAKYWQIRWEVAVKDLEIHLLEAMQDNPRRLHQIFTVDGKHLDEQAKQRLDAINRRPAREADQLTREDGFVQDLVVADLDRAKYWFFNRLMLALAVKKKWSVSKIPLWVGFFLCLFWLVLWLNTFALWGHTPLAWMRSWLFEWFAPDVFELRALKSDKP